MGFSRQEYWSGLPCPPPPPEDLPNPGIKPASLKSPALAGGAWQATVHGVSESDRTQTTSLTYFFTTNATREALLVVGESSNLQHLLISVV